MRDPHVVSLKYHLETSPENIFYNPQPIEQETDQFSLRLADDILVLQMKEHYSSDYAAKIAVADYLHSWEIDMALQLRLQRVRFVFQGAEVIDRNPLPPEESQGLDTSRNIYFATSASASLKVTCSKYPALPQNFVVTPDVETLWGRYEGYLNKREPLLSMAYFCLTVIEGSAGSRKDAGKKYSIDQAVLGKLGELSSTRGNVNTARKYGANTNQQDLTQNEVEWIKACIEAIIRRMAEQSSPNQQSKLTMADLPKL